ncbi:hypothetical protein ACQ3I4_15005 [Zafaria sp. Z1313]|uniref:hypothetical protein n=1 Tax=Zafaria sp. Z1313 TaxID=3423202 RepID=UPI003D3028CC
MNAPDGSCRSYRDGHDIYPLRLARARKDPTAWQPAHVTAFLPGFRVAVMTAGLKVARYTAHDVAEIVRLLNLAGQRLDHRVRWASEPFETLWWHCAWNEAARILGVPEDPGVGAGRRYFSLSSDELAPCDLEHDPELGLRFVEVTAGLLHSGA